ncbi:MAG: PEP-CTERM system histidine kinase PrsK [Novosphingobium sp.]|nr:PEP-CTERM system histidine kinase PrsK [Novosphingobium sp.]
MSWASAAFWSFLAGAFACAVLCAWIIQRGDDRPDGDAMALALGATSLWGLVAAATGAESASSAIAETMRNLAWLGFAYRLFAHNGAEAGIAAVRPVLVALVGVELLHPAILVAMAQVASSHPAQAAAFHLAVILRLAFVVGALVLAHNLYGNSVAGGRPALRWSAAALAVLWVCDLNFYTVAYLGERQPEALSALRGAVPVLVAALLAIGRTRASELRIRPSRAVAFQSLSLLVIAAYLIVMIGAAHALAWFGDAAPPLAQIGFVFTSAVLALVVLPSARLRGWMKVTVAKHLFQHRYDYRAEWLRFTRTIGRSDGGASLQERVVQALADITDSNAGLLLVPAEHGELALAARWQWRTLEVPAQALNQAGRDFFEREGFIVALDEVRAGKDRRGECEIAPEWLRAEQRAWAMVPLLHFERLVGVVVLSRPPHPRELDWEDFDLLRVVARQLASYLAEHSGQEALLDASRFDEFNRRIAFVMHDVKNLASQLTLLCRNAERHGENPAFRADMLVTVRNAADKLNALIARLSRYSAGSLERMEEIDPGEIVRAVAGSLGQAHAITVATAPAGLRVIGNRDSLEQVLVHLVQNAIDASPQDSPVSLGVRSDGMQAAIEVVDSGAGMSADFVRNRLFKPFVSTKPGGFGIGAFEARELVRAMQGRLDVESREGLGSRFVVRLPLAEAAGLFEKLKRNTAGASPDGSQQAKVA